MQEHINYIMNINGDVIKKTDILEIRKNKLLDNLHCYSVNVYPEQTSIGQTSTDFEQVLHFGLGVGEIKMNDFMYEVRPGVVVTIPKNTFYYFINKGKTNLYFVSVANGEVDY